MALALAEIANLRRSGSQRREEPPPQLCWPGPRT